MENKPIVVLVVEPMKKPVLSVLDGSLESMQKLVGGLIEEIMPFEDEVAIICNEEGKINGAPLNRALFGENGEILDILAGTFFLCYAPAESENFLSLDNELIHKYAEMFDKPEQFVRGPLGLQVIQKQRPASDYLGVNWQFHEHEDAIDIEFSVDAENGLDYINIDWHSVPKGSNEHKEIEKVAKEWAGNLAIDRAIDSLNRLESQMTIDDRLNDATERSEVYQEESIVIDILQVKAGPEYRDFRFAPVRWLKDGLDEVDVNNYASIYQYSDEDPVDISNENAVMDLLEKVFTRFNVRPPEDFKGHSLSVSDVVVLTRGKESKAYYCDSFGFEKLPDKFVKDFLCEKSKTERQILMED